MFLVCKVVVENKQTKSYDTKYWSSLEHWTQFSETSSVLFRHFPHFLTVLSLDLHKRGLILIESFLQLKKREKCNIWKLLFGHY